MTKDQALDLLMLLSALEPRGLATGNGLPKYLHERLCDAVEVLRNEVMK
jgi:hypothetical protein